MSYYLTIESFRRAKVTLILISINFLCFIIVNVINGGSSLNVVWLYYPDVVNKGEWWRLVTAIFFHRDIAHLISNMIALIVFGSFMEQNYRIWEYLLIYLTSGIVGCLFSLWYNPFNSAGLGASGAIFGIMGAAFIANARQNKNYLLFSLIYLVWDIYRSFDPGIGTWSHIFGLASGLILGFIIHRQKFNQSKYDFK